MNLLQNKNPLLNLFAIVSFTVTTAYLVVGNNYSATGSEPVQFINLTNADIEKILAVKTEMQAAKIQASLSI